MLRGLAVTLLLALNLAIGGTGVFLVAVVRLLTFGDARNRVILGAAWVAERWVAGNDAIFDLLLDTKWDFEGFEDLRRDGRYLVICNHASWVDIFALFRAFRGRGPFIRFFMKRILIFFPIAGQACWALEFPFMRRYTREYLEKHPEKRGRDLETTRRACSRYAEIPVTIGNFVEGTRFTREKQEDQRSPYRHLLRPRVGGIAFVLAAMAGRLDAVFDVAVVYPSHETTVVHFVTNRVDRVIVRARRLDVPPEFVGPATTEPGPARERFRAWVEQIWREKDDLIERLSR